MLTVLLLCVSWCALAVLVWRVYSRQSAHPLPPPMPGGIPIIGHTHLMRDDTAKIWKILKSMSVKCMQNGGVMYTQLGTQIYYIVTDPDDALTVANTSLPKHFIYNYLQPWLENGLFTSPEAVWQRHRKLLNPAFTVSVIHQFLAIFNHMSKQFVSEIKPHVGKGTFEITPYLRLIAFQTFSRTSFGIADENVKDFAREYMKSSDQIMNLVIHRFQNVWLQSDLLFRMSGRKIKQDRLVKHLDDLVNQVIERKKEGLKAKNENTANEWTTTDT